MRLYSSPASPYARKIRVILHEAGQLDNVEILPPQPETEGGSSVQEANPLGKIPTFIPTDGRPLFDSRVISRYLDATYALDLYPSDTLFAVLTLEALGDGILDAAITIVYEARFRPEEKVHGPWVERQWDKVTSALDALEGAHMADLSGPLTAGQIAIGCALGYLDFRHDARAWREGRPALAAWYAAFVTRPSMAETGPT